jgi:site-specific DNA-methyltransferase (adenine-specific)
MRELMNLVPYFNQDGFILHLGDSLDIMNQIEDESIDMIFADPPYNLSNDGITCHSGKMVSVNKGEWDKSKGVKKDFDFHFAWIEACKRILKPNGTIWISGTYHSIYACGYALQLLDYHIINDISWFKPNAAPNISCRCFTASHENLIWARKSKQSKHLFNYTDMKNGEWHTKDMIKNAEKQMRSVWSIPTPKPSEKIYGKHPTQKPVSLLERIILASTREGQTILDPFNGSGTTGVSAKKFNRNYIGIDKSEDYLNLTIKRQQDIHS